MPRPFKDILSPYRSPIDPLKEPSKEPLERAYQARQVGGGEQQELGRADLPAKLCGRLGFGFTGLRV